MAPKFFHKVYLKYYVKNVMAPQNLWKNLLKNNTCHVSWNLGRQKEKKRSVDIIGNIIW